MRKLLVLFGLIILAGSAICETIDFSDPANYPVGNGSMSVFSSDINGDCTVNLGDAGYLINYIFFDGPAPVVGCGVGVGFDIIS